MQGWDDSVMVRPATAMADQDIPTTYPLAVINMRPKPEEPFAKEAPHHVIVLRHGRCLRDREDTPVGRDGPVSIFGIARRSPARRREQTLISSAS
jgi:hypothetical protein